MNLRETAEEVFEWGVSQRTDNVVDAWKNHSIGVAKVAEVIAKQCGMDVDRAYASGLLHDIGRYKGQNTGMMHIIDGYEIMMDKNLPEIARICLTHSFNPVSKVQDMMLKDAKKDKFIKDYLENITFDDYDLLIQLADFMSGAHGITTIERRFCSVLWRHNLKNPQEDLLTLYHLKDYFDKKAGLDIYELFYEQITQSNFNGVPGRFEGKKCDEEDA